MNIVYGILALGIIVFVHELGHFIAAKICGVKVETFSIGMGPVLLHKKIKDTDWRLSLIPLGGYCGMKGQEDIQYSKDSQEDRKNADKDSFYGVSAFRRIVIAFFGPFFNVLFAVLAFTIISMIGYTNYTSGNKIILANEIYPEISSSAKEAGLLTGDKIISINDKDVSYFSDITQIVSLHPDENLEIKVDRKGEILSFTVSSVMDKSTGAGKIGVVSWVDPIISEVEKNSISAKAGFKPGDIITKINGQSIDNTATFQKLFTQALENNSPLDITVIEKSSTDVSTEKNITLTIPQSNDNESIELGLYFDLISIKTPGKNLFKAIAKGWKDTFEMLGLTFKSLGLLFKGVDLTQAVSGPLRITVMLGDTAKAGFAEGFTVGLVAMLNFLSLISISLFIMNLLPIPILDGGLILFAIIEGITKKPISAKTQYYVQFIGIAIIVLLFAFALFGDISYLINKWR